MRYNPARRPYGITVLRAIWLTNLKDEMSIFLEPGAYVRHPGQPDWGIGQIQTVIGSRITVNFQNAGKRVINGDVIDLQVIDISD